MKIDIEELKAKFYLELKNAEESNMILDILGDNSLKVSIDNHSYLKKGKKSLTIRPENVRDKLTIKQAGLILSKFPSTENVKVRGKDGKDIEVNYKISTRRGYRDSYATLHIWYISGDYDISLRLPIEPNKELNGYFADSSRKVDQSEITTYYIVSRPNRKAADVTVPVKVFANGEYVRYAGGCVSSVTQIAIDNIIEAIIATCYEK